MNERQLLCVDVLAQLHVLCNTGVKSLQTPGLSGGFFAIGL
jgi:hypothetical protein